MASPVTKLLDFLSKNLQSLAAITIVCALALAALPAYDDYTLSSSSSSSLTRTDDLFVIPNKPGGYVTESSGGDIPKDLKAAQQNKMFSVSQFVDGKITYTSPVRMPLNKSDEIILVINPNTIDRKVLEEDFKRIFGKSSELSSMALSVSPTMTATLTVSTDGLKIIGEKSQTQDIARDSITTWKWYVLAEKEGIHTIYIELKAKVDNQFTTLGGNFRVGDIPPIPIRVIAGAAKKVEGFFEKYFEIFLTAVILPALGFLLGVARRIFLKRRKEKRESDKWRDKFKGH